MGEWTGDSHVLNSLDDLFQMTDGPFSEFMEAIWKYHEDSVEWFTLTIAASFVRHYNQARFEGIMVEGGRVVIFNTETSLRYAVGQVMSNPTLQMLIGQGLGSKVDRRVKE